MNNTLRPVAVVGGMRIPFCRSNSAYSDLSNMDMFVTALNGLVDKFNLKGELIEEVLAGAVITHSRDWNFARESVLSSLGRARSAMDKLKMLKGFGPKELKPLPPSVNEPRTLLSMGQHCELMAKEWGITREAQDQLAYESHTKAAAAYNEGFFDDLITPCNKVLRDNNMRPDTTTEKLAGLRNAYDKSDEGTLSAGNSTPLTDGASSVLLASEEWAKERGLPIQAYLTHGQTSAVDFVDGEGLLMAPAVAVSDMIKRAGITLQDFDFYEIHEAFAAQVLCTLAAWESEEYCVKRLGRDGAMGSIDRAKLNLKGSSLAVGHPFAATGARIVSTLGKIIDEHNGGRGLISVCTAGGMGVTAIMER